MTSDIINIIKNKYDYARIEKCCESGCSVKLDSIIPRVVLRGETLARVLQNNPEKACDCIIFTHTTVVAIIMVELKGRLTTAKGILEKFENSADILCRILKKQGIKDYKINAILASKSFVKRPSLYNGLLRKIKIGNTMHAVRKIKCGDHLVNFT